MFGGDFEKIIEDDEHILYRLSWYVNGEYKEKWITKRKDELEDDGYG
ncbi:hypothetical protein [Virgibacillus sp. Bac332]|nr:hypothetical protein [Virgibacillus sp. Bac332]